MLSALSCIAIIYCISIHIWQSAWQTGPFVNVSVNQKFLTWLEYQNYYEVHEGAVEPQNYVRKRLTKKECFKMLMEDGQRRGWLDVRWQWVAERGCRDWKCVSTDGCEPEWLNKQLMWCRRVKSSTTGQVGDTNKIIQVRWRETMQHTKCHDGHLEVDSLW